MCYTGFILLSDVEVCGTQQIHILNMCFISHTQGYCLYCFCLCFNVGDSRFLTYEVNELS